MAKAISLALVVVTKAYRFGQAPDGLFIAGEKVPTVSGARPRVLFYGIALFCRRQRGRVAGIEAYRDDIKSIADIESQRAQGSDQSDKHQRAVILTIIIDKGSNHRTHD